MTIEVEVRVEKARGCGFRKPGGTYLMAGGVGYPCGKMPLALERCPTCSCGIVPSRSWQWVDAPVLFRDRACMPKPPECRMCPLGKERLEDLGRVGLLWVGEAFYKTPADFLNESASMGVSRRIQSVPLDFVLGKTWVLLAHRKGIAQICSDYLPRHPINCDLCENTGYVTKPAVFQLFRPSAIEYVTTGDESEPELERLVERGITPVRVIQDEGGQPTLI